MRRGACAALLALLLVPVASADDRALLRARQRYLPPASRSHDGSPEGLQARYDAGRDLVEAVLSARRVSRGCLPLARQLLALGRAQARIAESHDGRVARVQPLLPRVTGRCVAGGLSNSLLQSPPRPAPSPPSALARLPGATDARLAARLARLGRSFDGWAGFWVHDLRNGRTAGWNSDARFPAASTVKLGALVAALGRRELAYDATQLASWSSNLAANRIAERLGLPAVEDGLRRLGMVASTYPGLYRAGTSTGVDAPNPPPHAHTRVTTARDLGRALLRIHAAAAGRRWALRATGLTRAHARTALALLVRSQPVADNAGLLRPWLGRRTLLAQKHGWLSDTRITAAIVYRPSGPVIVVVEAHRPGITLAGAQALGRRVVAAIP